MLLFDALPVTLKAEARALASRFSKFATATVSPTVWSEPADTPKFTAVMPPETVRTSVSLPAPPSIEASPPRNNTVSLPAPAAITSAPPLPSIVSAPAPPVIAFAPVEPVIVAAWVDVSPEASAFWKPVTVVRSPAD